MLATQTASHGGPVAYVEGARAGDRRRCPACAGDRDLRRRSGRPGAQPRRPSPPAAARCYGRDVEDALYPAGWDADAGALLRKGAVGLSGDERPAAGALRRDAALLRHWAAAVPAPAADGRAASRRPASCPTASRAVELVSPAASAVSIINRGSQPFHDELRVLRAGLQAHRLTIPGVTVPAGESLWLPLSVSLGAGRAVPRMLQLLRCRADGLRHRRTALHRI